MVLHSSLSAATAEAHRRDLLTAARRNRSHTGPNSGAGSVVRRIARAVLRGAADRPEPGAASGPVVEKWSANRRYAVPR